MLYTTTDEDGNLVFVEGSPPTLVADALLGEGNSFSRPHAAFPEAVSKLRDAMMGATLDTEGAWGNKSILRYMFSWFDTEQGHEYWEDIDTDLGEGEDFPPEAWEILSAIWAATKTKEVPALEDML